MSALNLNCKHFKVVVLSSKHLRNTFTLSISPKHTCNRRGVVNVLLSAYCV